MSPLFSISESILPNIPTDFFPSILIFPVDSFFTFAVSAKIPTEESIFIVILFLLVTSRFSLEVVSFLP